MKKSLVTLAVLLVVTGCNTQSTTKQGKEGTALKLTTPKTVTVTQEDTAKVNIAVERTKFDDAVTVKFDKLPDGVTIEEEGKIDKGVKERAFTVKASDKAKAGKHTIQVVAAHGDLKSDAHEVTIEVKERQVASTSKSSPVTDDLKAKREQLNTTVQKQLKEANEGLTELRERAKTADAKIKVDLNKRIEELDTQRKALETDMARVQTTTAEAWEDFSTRLTRAANDLAAGTRKAMDQFKK